MTVAICGNATANGGCHFFSLFSISLLFCLLILFYLWLKISLYYCLFGYWLILLGFGDLGLGLGVGLRGGILWWCLV